MRTITISLAPPSQTIFKQVVSATVYTASLYTVCIVSILSIPYGVSLPRHPKLTPTTPCPASLWPSPVWLTHAIRGTPEWLLYKFYNPRCDPLLSCRLMWEISVSIHFRDTAVNNVSLSHPTVTAWRTAHCSTTYTHAVTEVDSLLRYDVRLFSFVGFCHFPDVSIFVSYLN